MKSLFGSVGTWPRTQGQDQLILSLSPSFSLPFTPSLSVVYEREGEGERERTSNLLVPVFWDCRQTWNSGYPHSPVLTQYRLRFTYCDSTWSSYQKDWLAVSWLPLSTLQGNDVRGHRNPGDTWSGPAVSFLEPATSPSSRPGCLY